MSFNVQNNVAMSQNQLAFRSTDNIPNQIKNQKNVFSVSDNAQNVLNKTNEYANGVQIANAVIEPNNRKENLKNAAINALTMPIMSSTPVSTIYTLSEYQKGNISKDDTIKIVAYNALAQSLS